MKRISLGIVFLFVFTSLTGCFRPEQGQVQGKVTYNGYNLRSGLVVFVPDVTKNEVGVIATGKIREDGSFTMYTGTSMGVPAGYYRVTVSSLAPSSYDQSFGGKFDYPQSIIPEFYRDPDQSQLTCKVEPKRMNDFHIALVDRK
jgi:hypothetical protein